MFCLLITYNVRHFVKFSFIAFGQIGIQEISFCING